MNQHPGSDAATGNGGEPSSSHAFDIVAAALHRVAECMDEACPGQAESARLIRLGRLQEAFPLISECVALWQEVQTLLAAAAKAIAQPIERLAVLVLSGSAPVGREPLAELASLLETLRRSVHAKDWIGLADALEYDLVALAQRWRSALLQTDEAEDLTRAGETGCLRIAPAA